MLFALCKLTQSEQFRRSGYHHQKVTDSLCKAKICYRNALVHTKHGLLFSPKSQQSNLQSPPYLSSLSCWLTSSYHTKSAAKRSLKETKASCLVCDRFIKRLKFHITRNRTKSHGVILSSKDLLMRSSSQLILSPLLFGSS